MNIGCGKDIKKGFINIDMTNAKGVDKIIDLNKDRLIYYFQKDSVDFILMSHILEHLINPYEVVIDCHFILKKGGVLLVKLPSSASCGWGHLRNNPTTTYFFSLTGKSKAKGLDSRGYFDVKVFKNWRHFPFKEWCYKRYLNFREWLFRQVYDEYIYELKKK